MELILSGELTSQMKKSEWGWHCPYSTQKGMKAYAIYADPSGYSNDWITLMVHHVQPGSVEETAIKNLFKYICEMHNQRDSENA